MFAKTPEQELKLDLFLPKAAEREKDAAAGKPPLVVFMHGGGWRNNSYKNCHVTWLTEYGFAVASVGYRLSDASSTIHRTSSSNFMPA